MIICIFILIIVIITIYYISKKEHFTEGVPLKYRIDDHEMLLFNITEFNDQFYELTDKECSTDCVEGECIDGKCYIKRENMEAFKLVKSNKSYMILNDISAQNMAMNISFVLEHISEHDNPLIESYNGRWNIIIQKNKLIVNTFNNKKKLFSNKFNKTLEPFIVYQVSININNNILRVNLEQQTLNLNLVNNDCNQGSDLTDCGLGSCSENIYGKRKCSYTNDHLFLGHSYLYNSFFEGYIGNLKINKTVIENLRCNLEKINSDVYSIKNECLSDCKNHKCNESTCLELCKDIPVCSFKLEGRHSVDCVKKCFKNSDCNIEYCSNICNNCYPNCPWNKSPNEDLFETDDNEDIPIVKLQIDNISYHGRDIKLKWKKPKNSKAKGYIVFLYKTFEKTEGIRLFKMSCNNYSDYCEYLIRGIDPTVSHTAGVKGFNESGLGRMSNLVTFVKPDVSSINTDFKFDDIDKSTIGEYKYCNDKE